MNATNLERTRNNKHTYAGDTAAYAAALMDARRRDAEVELRREARELVGPIGDALRDARAAKSAAFAAWESARDQYGYASPEASAAWDAVIAARDHCETCVMRAVRAIEDATE